MLFGKLLPREGNFFEMFNQHADRIVEAAHAFSKLVANYNDPDLRAKYNQEVDDAERAADRVTHDVNKAIHITFITPIDREQIHSLNNTMDDVADLIQDSAETMALYDVRHMTEEITRLEEQADELNDQGIKALFLRSRSGNAMDFIIGNEIYDHLEKVVDRFEDVANRISGIVIEPPASIA